MAKCIHIDTGNTVTLRYMKEVDHMLMPEEGAKNAPKKKKASDTVLRYQSGNETIIQPINNGEKKGVSSLLNLGIGLVIGIGIAFFLILPARIQSAKADIDDKLRRVSEQSDAKTATIDEQVQKIQSLTDENQRLTDELAILEGTDGALQATDGLMLAVNAYLSDPEDIETIAKYMEAFEAQEDAEDEKRTESFEKLWEGFLAVTSQPLSVYYFNMGNGSYRAESYEEAIPNLERAYRYDPTNIDALFYLGNSYRSVGNTDKAKEVYAQVIDNFPNTDRANRSQTYLAEINNEN